MEIHSSSILHYGADYLSYALRSVYDQVDRLHIFYTPTPSHGHRSALQPPETRDQLLLAAFAFDPDGKVGWHDAPFTQEGPQRDSALRVCMDAGADLVVVLDADEIWPEETLSLCLQQAASRPGVRNWLVNFTTLWRSFHWVCRDELWPVRIINLRAAAVGEYTAYLDRSNGEAYHFGYAVRDEIMRYKMSCHGHKGEWRRDWYESKWLAWPPVGDCHPTCERTWTPEPFDAGSLPGFMQAHPFYDLGKIE